MTERQERILDALQGRLLEAMEDGLADAELLSDLSYAVNNAAEAFTNLRNSSAYIAEIAEKAAF